MLILTRAPGARIYIGETCIVQFEGLTSAGSAILRVWADGRQSEHHLPLNVWLKLPLPGTRMKYLSKRLSLQEQSCKLGFEAPRGTRISRAEILPARIRAAIRAAAGVESGDEWSGDPAAMNRPA